MRKKIYAALLLAALSCSALAKPVDPERAIRTAQRHLTGTAFDVVKFGEVYLVTPAGGEGYVLVSSDDCAVPVLAYSPTGRFPVEDIPTHVQAWLDGYSSIIAELVESGEAPSAAVQAQWEAGYRPRRTAMAAVEPLVLTQWDQSPYYNIMCPYDFQYSQRAPTGCAATAMAQVMKYWNHPATGRGSSSYIHPDYGFLAADYGATQYQWEAMPQRLTGASDSAAVAAVATLMYHVGVSVEMNYGYNSSGAILMTSDSPGSRSCEMALRDYFRYSPLLAGHMRSDYTDAEWDNLMYAEVSHGRPVLYGGQDADGGHAFILDGYDGAGKFHFNWGWGGYYDGYFVIDSLNPGSGGIGGTATNSFNLFQRAIVGIEPSTQASVDVSVIDFYADPEQGTLAGNGSYTPYADTVQVLAQAADGYRFAGWARIGTMANPLTFVVAGDMADTATFVPIEGDTIGYCGEQRTFCWRDEDRSRSEWGIRIPAERHAAMRRLSAVQFYVPQQDVYTLRIYLGDSISDVTLVYEEDLYQDFGDALNQWYTFSLREPVALYGDKPLWVTLYTIGGGLPAACSVHGGNGDGTWRRTSQGWVRNADRGSYTTWMLRAVLEERPFYVALQSLDGCTDAHPYGSGYYEGGETAVVGVEDGYLVDAAGNALADNPVTLTVTADTIFRYRCNPSSVSSVDDAGAILVAVERNAVIASTEADVPLQLFDLQGRLLASCRRSLTVAVPAPGVYILRAGASIKRIVVL